MQEEQFKHLAEFGQEFEKCGGVRALVLAASFDDDDDYIHDDMSPWMSELEYALGKEEAHRGLGGSEEELEEACAANFHARMHYGPSDWVLLALTDYYASLGKSAAKARKAYDAAVFEFEVEPKIEEAATQALGLSREISALKPRSFVASELAESARHNLEMASAELRALIEALREAA